MNDDEEIVQAFLEESRENLDQLERDLVTLETSPGEPGLLAEIYRAIHTIKGTCGFLGYHRLETLTHVGENLLDEVRSGAFTLDAETTSCLLALVDAIRAVLDRIAVTGQEGDDPHTELIEMLTARTAAGIGSVKALPAPIILSTPEPSPDLPSEHQPSMAPPTVGPAPSESSVRVDVAMLDNLMDLVGELVLARNQIGALVADEDSPLSAPYRRLRVVTAELQERVMESRLQPMGRVTGKFRRIVRDLAASLGKQVHLELEGEDVAVDKAVNEALSDPLLHLVRNAIDHGLEGPAERIAAGKDPEGALRIRTFHAGGLVHLEVSDDGRGIDARALASSAVRAGLFTAEAAARLDRGRSLDLMFLPGLSTNDQVTTVSGRGVGLDVVRTNIEQVGGSIEVTTEAGLGTRFRINVPLTLAIMTTVMVWSRGGRYAVPQVHVQEVVHLDAGGVAEAVDDIGGARILRHRGRLTPLVELADHFGLTDAGASAASDGMDVIVVDIDGRFFGVVVDAVGESVEAVVKPLTRATRTIPVFAGVTILGDGQPSLIIDLAGLATAAGLPSATDAERAVGDTKVEPGEPEGEHESLLIATQRRGGCLAVPVATVLRLEQFGCDRVEDTGSGEVIQYNGSVLPILRVADLLAGPSARSIEPLPRSVVQHGLSNPDLLPMPGDLQTIVCQSSAGPVGLIVDRIDDVISSPAVPSPQPSQLACRPGVAACLVIKQRITEVLDIEALLVGAGLQVKRPR